GGRNRLRLRFRPDVIARLVRGHGPATSPVLRFDKESTGCRGGRPVKSLVVAAALSLAALPALAVETSMQLVLELEGSAQRDVTTYQCDGIEEPMVVEYINAHPIFLAMVPV